ncbi:hypothetical protein D9M72_538850 [compost metagenome]
MGAEVQHDMVDVAGGVVGGEPVVAGHRRGDWRPHAVQVHIRVRRRPWRALRGVAAGFDRLDADVRRGRSRRRGRGTFDCGVQLRQRHLGRQFVPQQLRLDGIGVAAQHGAPVVDGAGRARRQAGIAAVADLGPDHVVAVVVGDGVDRAGVFAGIAADADFRVDQVLLDDVGGAHRYSPVCPGSPCRLFAWFS